MIAAKDCMAHINAPTYFEHKGKTYTLSQPTLRDLKETRDYFRGQIVKDYDGLIRTVEAKEIKDVLLSQMKDEVAAMEIESPAFAKCVQRTIDGMVYILWVTMRGSHPEVTREEVAAWFLEDAVSQEALKRKAKEALGLEGGDDSPNAVTPPAKAGKKKSTK